ncbi:RNA polymerase sigma-70 factor [Puteibacter caeruleilacunae]|nr:RNA polymerase sigma-70 factor [Puteibacter caeruleilacunae]
MQLVSLVRPKTNALPMKTDADLVKAIANGGKKDFEILFKRYYPRMCSYAFTILKDSELSEDIVSEFFLKLWDRYHILRISGSVSSYLFQSVRNDCINYLTREKYNKNTVSENEITLLHLRLKYNCSEDNPYMNLVSKELAERIQKEIAALPPQCREIFELSRIEQLSHEEIATRLGISKNTVKVQIYRALLRFKIRLSPYLSIFF